MPVVRAIRTLIMADSLANSLARWDFGDGVGRSAVFAVDPAPETCKGCFVTVSETGSAPYDNRGRRGMAVSVDVKLWGDKGRSEKVLRDIAWKLWLLLDRADLTVTGYLCAGCDCDGPQKVVDGDGFPGYKLPVTVKVMEV